MLPDCRAVNSAVELVNGSSSNSLAFGLSGPEYDLFGSMIVWPVTWKPVFGLRCHGPSTTCQSGLVSQVDSDIEALLRYL